MDRQPFRLKAVDGVGNRYVTSVSWRIDSSPPTISLENAAGQRFDVGTTLSIRPNEIIFPKIEDAGCGVDEVLCWIDNKKPLTVTDGYRFDREEAHHRSEK